MKKLNSFLKKSITLLLAGTILIISNIYEVKAQEYIKNETIALTDENGDICAYYTPYSDTNPEPTIKPRYTSNINWTINAGRYTVGDNQYTLSSGISIQINVSQSKTGKSYIILYNRSTNTYKYLTNTETTNGWNGTINLGNNFNGGLYSIGIANLSSNTITYSGSYSL